MPRTHSLQLARRRFGRLRVLRETERRALNLEILWECRCRCGRTTLVSTSNLVSGNTTSCGCYRRENARAAGRLGGLATARRR